ncbi:MAG: hypothetical protein ACI85O_002621 [Saprospiraceae bacterium]|jgi:hypothetical protein
MKRIALSSLTFVLFALFLQSCGSEASTEEDKNSISLDYTVTDDDGKKSAGELNIDLQEPQEALNEISKALEGINLNIKKDGKEVEIINFRELKKRFPSSIAGMERKSSEGQTTGFGGMKVSVAEAKYRDGDQRLDLTITDTGGLGAALMGMAFWSNLEMDKETEYGFERTTEIDGHKAYMKYDRRREQSEIAVIFDNRFLAVAKGKGIDFDDLQEIIEDLDLDDLE